MNLHTFPQTTPAPATPWSQATVVQCESDSPVRLDDGRAAELALSCLLRPCVGDQVLVWHGPQQAYITQILAHAVGASQEPAVLSVPGAHTLSIRQARLDLMASEHLSLRCLNDVEISSLRGAIRSTAQDILSAASETLVHTARHWIAQAELAALQISGLLRAHSQQALITAEKDLKLDAERISLG